jgi:hypothetical protein
MVAQARGRVPDAVALTGMKTKRGSVFEKNKGSENKKQKKTKKTKKTKKNKKNKKKNKKKQK